MISRHFRAVLLALTLATTALHHLERGAMRLLVQVEPSFEGERPEAHVQLGAAVELPARAAAA